MPVHLNQPSVAHRPIVRAHRPPRLPPDPAILAVTGMHGLGDNLHQRAIVRQLMLERTVYLETPWPCIYHDLVGPKLKLVNKRSPLRTQAKNAAREADQYTEEQLPPLGTPMRIWYSGDDVRKHGSILAAMLANAGCDLATSDFRLPVPQTWRDNMDPFHVLHLVPKPILVYRPLVERTEWRGCAMRNPDFDAYYKILDAIRHRFLLVSVADLLPGTEWMVGHPVQADVTFHRGELPFEQLAALVRAAGMVYCSPGFATLLAQAVGTPAVCVFGGHESSMTVQGGARFTPTLGIDPIDPCNCFSHTHACRKAIDIPRAIARVTQFIEENVRVDNTRGGTGHAAVADDQLDQSPQAIHESERIGGAMRLGGPGCAP